jgi:hypothetical protein
VASVSSAPTDLTVRGESLQRLYDLYVNDRFRVNRRYQRKLVWSVDEKERLVDSIVRDMPIPLFLVAEIGTEAELTYELIDGMQRLNAMFSFLENEFALGDLYFDLNALADTKLRLDEGTLEQRTPVMPRDAAVRFSNYTVALSVFRAPQGGSVDEVFRRINSGGRRLSRQELRQAGTTSSLADIVRVLSSRIRGDTSPGDIVPLRQMPKLSITNRDLPYGVPADEIYWVKEGVLRREDVRESADEQLLLDILLDCLIEPMPNSGTRTRDEYYDYTEDDSGSATTASKAITSAIEIYGPDRLVVDVLRVYDEIRGIVALSVDRFSSLIGVQSGGRSPRYYHALFVSFFELMLRERMRLADPDGAAATLRGISTTALQVPGGGGDWNREAKRGTINAVKGRLRDHFEPAPSGSDLGRFGWAAQLETLLGNALVEQQLFDCKQGLLSLGTSREFDEDAFTRVCRTLVAMANHGVGAVGYVVLGIADSTQDAERVAELDGIVPQTYRGFHIVGIDREATILDKSLNDFWLWLNQRLRAALPNPVGQTVTQDSRIVPYRGHTVALLKAAGASQPVFLDEVLYERAGSETVQVQHDDYFRIAQRFTTASRVA